MSQGKEYLQEITRLYRDYINPDLTRVMRVTGLGTLEERASGSVVWDHEGLDYLDMAGGYGMFCLGHSHPKVVAAVKEQLDKMSMSAKVFFTPAQARLAQALAEITPGELRYSFFCNSGTEAVEGALKIALLARPERHTFIAALNAFHGKSTGALAVSGRPNYRAPFEPLMPTTKHVPYGDAAALEEIMDDTVAAVILEPVQGEGGIHVPPADYFKAARALCDRYGALLIADEVQTGFGRTGKMFACQHWDVAPDIMAVAKALGGGILPIGATLGTKPVWDAAFKGRPLIHTSTFGGSPLACTAGLATLQVLQEENLPQRAAATGAYMLERLKELAGQYPDLCREARGLGLMLGLELNEEKFGGMIISEMSRRRIIAVYTLNQPKVIRFEPPLNVSRQDVDRTLSALSAALETTREFFAKH